MNNHCIKISDIVNDCTTYCIETTAGEALSSILQKLCTKIDDFEEEDPVFTQWLATTPLDQEGKVFSSDGTQFIWILPEELPGLVVNVSTDENNCLETREDGLFVECSSSTTLYTVSNGLTEDPETNFKLGGILEEETLFTQSIFGFTLDYDGTNFALHANNSSNGGGLWGQTSDGYGVYGTATSGLGVVGAATTGTAGTFQNISDDFPALNVTNQGIGNVADFSNVDGQVASIFSTGQLRLHNYGIGTFADTATFILGVDSNGNVIETATSGLYTFQNALTNTAGTVELGGTLLHTTTINSAGFGTILTGSVNGNSLYVLNTDNTHSVTAISGEGSGVGGVGVHGEGGSVGVVATSTLGIGVSAIGAQGANINSTTATTTGNEIMAYFTRNSGGTTTNNVSGSLNMGIEDDSGAAHLSNQIISKMTTVASLSRVSELSFTGVNNAITSTLFTLAGSGAARFNKYGVGTFTGTPTHLLSVDSSGNVIEGPAGQRFGVAGEDDTLLGNRNVDMNASNLSFGGNMAIQFHNTTSQIFIASVSGGIFLGSQFGDGSVTSPLTIPFASDGDSFVMWSSATGQLTHIDLADLFVDLQDFADDAAAAVGLIGVNRLYRTGSFIKVRVS